MQWKVQFKMKKIREAPTEMFVIQREYANAIEYANYYIFISYIAKKNNLEE